MANKPGSEMADVSVQLEYSVASRAHADFDENEDYLLRVHGKIVGSFSEPMSGEADVLLGQLGFSLIRVGNAVDDGFDLDELFDVEQETTELSRALFDSSYEQFSPETQKRFPEASPCGDLLLFNRLTINPLARGQKLGLAVIRRAIRDWASGCSLVVMKPFPLQFESGAKQSSDWNDFDLGAFRSKQKEAQSKLAAYYQQLGFERLGRSPYYGLCPLERRPPLRALKIPTIFRVPAASLPELKMHTSS